MGGNSDEGGETNPWVEISEGRRFPKRDVVEMPAADLFVVEEPFETNYAEIKEAIDGKIKEVETFLGIPDIELAGHHLDDEAYVKWMLSEAVQRRIPQAETLVVYLEQLHKRRNELIAEQEKRALRGRKKK